MSELSNPPVPINITFGMSDYVGRITQHTKIHNNRPSGGVSAHAWNITLARLNRRTGFYVVYFIRCQFRVIAFLER